MPHIHYCPQQHCCTANYSIIPRCKFSDTLGMYISIVCLIAKSMDTHTSGIFKLNIWLRYSTSSYFVARAQHHITTAQLGFQIGLSYSSQHEHFASAYFMHFALRFAHRLYICTFSSTASCWSKFSSSRRHAHCNRGHSCSQFQREVTSSDVRPHLSLWSIRVFVGGWTRSSALLFGSTNIHRFAKGFKLFIFFTYANTTELWLRNQCTSPYFEEIQTYWFSNHTSAVINFSHLKFNIVIFFRRQRPCVVNIFGSI